MNTTELLNEYSGQIQSVAAYAKSIGFNFESGNFDALMRGWLKYTKAMHESIMDNKEQATKLLKQLTH